MFRSILAVVLGLACLRGELLAQAKFSEIKGPRVSIEKKCPPERFVGTPIKYDITIVNEGDAPALDVVISDRICETAKFISASEGGQVEEGSVVWRLGDIAPGKSVTVTSKLEGTKIGAKLDCPASVEWRAIASVKDKCKTSIEGIPAILLEVIDLNDPIELGDVETYEIKVTNQGSLAGRDIVVKATLPEQLQFESGDGPTGKPEAEGQVITYPSLDSLDPKDHVVFVLKAKTVGVGDIRFRLDLTSAQSPEPIFETESTNIYK